MLVQEPSHSFIIANMIAHNVRGGGWKKLKKLVKIVSTIGLLHSSVSVPHAIFDYPLIPCFPQPVRPVIIILSLVDHIVTIIVTLSITFLTITLIDRLAEIFG